MNLSKFIHLLGPVILPETNTKNAKGITDSL